MFLYSQTYRHTHVVSPVIFSIPYRAFLDLSPFSYRSFCFCILFFPLSSLWIHNLLCDYTTVASLVFLLTISHSFVNDDSRPLLYFCLCPHSMTVLTLTPLNWTMDWLALFLSLSLCSILLFCHCHPPSCIHSLEWVSFSIAEGHVESLAGAWVYRGRTVVLQWCLFCSGFCYLRLCFFHCLFLLHLSWNPTIGYSLH